MFNRYDTSDNPEGQYQPGSDETVLLNQLGITNVDDMENIEYDLLIETQESLFDLIEVDQILTSQDLCHWHQRWLGSVYEWAGRYRSVNMGKDGFTFAASNLIPKLMQGFETQYLAKYTPCSAMDDEALIEALAACHVEFIIIHPFREGNGRLGRLLLNIMALQAGKPPLDFEYLVENKTEYIAAIHAGHAGNYEPMRQVFSQILRLTQ